MSIDFEVHDRIALITINRPERLNALDHQHYVSLSEAWIEVRDNPDIWAAIITGAGDRAFCSGADLKEFIPDPPPPSQMWQTQQDPLLNRGLEVWKPVIAAINGWCLGGGMTLMLATDIRIACPGARFGLPEVKRGIIAGNGGTQRIFAQLPYPVAMEFLLTGDAFEAETALRWGLINKITEPETLLDEAFAYARRIVQNAPLAVRATKELVLRSQDVDLQTGLRMEQMFNRFLMDTLDAAEGTSAFSDKRPAQFQGN